LTAILGALEFQIAGPPDEYRFGRKDEMTIVVADTAELRDRAAALVGRRPGRGLHDLLPASTVFLAQRGDQDVATATVVFDGPLGLPLDATAKKQLNALRADGRQLCEIYAVAASKSLGFAARDALLHLFRLAHLTAREMEDASDLLVGASPRHSAYSKRFAMRLMLLNVPGVGVASSSAVFRLNLEEAESEFFSRGVRQSGERDLHSFMHHERACALAWLKKRRRILPETDLIELLSRRRAEYAELPAQERYAFEDLYLAYDLRRMLEK
jgi:hypothetical protein